jgi:hypothetical protein
VNSSVLSAARRRDVGVVATDNVPLTMISWSDDVSMLRLCLEWSLTSD